MHTLKYPWEEIHIDMLNGYNHEAFQKFIHGTKKQVLMRILDALVNDPANANMPFLISLLKSATIY